VQQGITPRAEAIAATTGIPRRTIARLLAGHTVSLRTADDLAAELGVAREHLFDTVKVR
jgi:plasmid maintenance system antidote protein VapI